MLQNMSDVFVLHKYGEDDFSFWIFAYREDAPVQLDLNRSIQGTLADIFTQIGEEDEWVLLRRANDYVVYPVRNLEMLGEKYIADGYSERGTLAQIYETLKEDYEEHMETAEDAEEDNEI
jgi:hypothetical protein